MGAHAEHVHPASHAAVANRVDPTRTATVRRRFAQHLRARFDAIKWHVRKAILDRDVFGLSSPDRTVGLDAANVDTDEDIQPPTRAWAAIPTAEAVARFDTWLDDAMEREVLSKYDGDTYIEHGYLKGVQNADIGLKNSGIVDPESPDNLQAVIRRPVHRRELDRIYTQAYQSLDGITDAAANQMRRELAEGLGQGQNPRKIARSLTDRVEKVGRTRATVLARTEVIRAHSESTLTRFESVAGDVSVTVKAEWLTAGDRRVCPDCAALEGNEYKIEEARGMLPLHPQCRCTWRPLQKT